MLVRKSFRYRLRLTKKQIRGLQSQLDACRWLYNQLLEQRKLAYEELDISLTKYAQTMLLPLLKEERESLLQVHSQVLQIGSLRVKMHRPIEGVIKTCTLRRNASGNWDVCFSCEVDVKPLPAKEESIGIDVGLEHFATLSNGQEISNPRFFKQGEKSLAKAQRKLAKLTKGTPERRKQGKAVAKIHEKISNQRKDFCHQQSKAIVEQFQYICVEDLDIRKMVEKSYLAKSITDASWNQFRQFLTYKAAEAGRKLGLVNPAYTSQDCSQCGHREEKKLSERMHCCSQCGYRATRDFNAAQNILALGLDGLGAIPRSLRL